MKDVTFAYGGDADDGMQVKGVNLILEAGEMLAITGESGSGKSTVARLASGLLQPLAGQVEAAAAALVAQDPEANMFAETVWEDVTLAPAAVSEGRGIQWDEAEKALRLVNMFALKDRSLLTLSGGELQRTAIAGALADGRQLLILDEPTSHLSAPDASRFWNAIYEIRRTCEVGILLITHHPWEIIKADRVMVLTRGRVALVGRPEQLLSRPKLMETFGLRQYPQAIVDRYIGSGDDGPRDEQATDSDRRSRLSYDTSPDSGDGDEEVAFPPNAGHEEVRLVVSEVSVRSVSNASFSVVSGEAVALIGASGAGKSSLLTAMAGLTPYTGKVTLDGRRVDEAFKKDPKWFHQRVGIALQFPERSFFQVTVRDELRFTSGLLRLNRREVDARIDQWLSEVGLSGRHAGRSPFTLSGGEKRRVGLLAAILHQPGLILFDEPDAGLDWTGKRTVSAMIGRLKAQGRAIVAATHDVAWALTWADRFVFIEDGQAKVFEPSWADLVPVPTKIRLTNDAPAEFFSRWCLDGGSGDAIYRRLREVGLTVAHPYRNETQFWRDIISLANVSTRD